MYDRLSDRTGLDSNANLSWWYYDVFIYSGIIIWQSRIDTSDTLFFAANISSIFDRRYNYFEAYVYNEMRIPKSDSNTGTFCADCFAANPFKNLYNPVFVWWWDL